MHLAHAGPVAAATQALHHIGAHIQLGRAHIRLDFIDLSTSEIHIISKYDFQSYT